MLVDTYFMILILTLSVDRGLNIDFNIGSQECKTDVKNWVTDLLKSCGLDGNQEGEMYPLS